MPASYRRPSPQLCQSCLRLHVRLPAQVRMDRRADLIRSLASAPADITFYALALFDHLTMAQKAVAPGEEQRYPAPDVPEGWDATGLALVEATAVRMAFDL